MIMCYRKLAKNKLLVLFLLAFLVFYLRKCSNHASPLDNIHYLKTVNEDRLTSKIALLKNYSRRFTLMHKSYKRDSFGTTKQKSSIEQVECNAPPFLLILVHSKPNHFLRREAIRNSWGKQDDRANIQGSLHKRFVILLDNACVVIIICLRALFINL